MKKSTLPFLALTFGLALTCGNRASAITGYINTTFRPGYNFFSNLFNTTNNAINSVMTVSLMLPDAPIGTAVTKWNPLTQQYLPYSIFNGSTWSDNFSLNPGEGAVLHTTSFFTNTFFGELTVNPIIPSRPAGVYLLGPSGFFDPGGYGKFENIIGRPALDGDSVTQFDPIAQIFRTKIMDSNWGGWVDEQYNSTMEPQLLLGESAFFGLLGGSAPGLPAAPPLVPEPTTGALLLLGGLVIRHFGRIRTR